MTPTVLGNVSPDGMPWFEVRLLDGGFYLEIEDLEKKVVLRIPKQAAWELADILREVDVK